jgi:uncharacterized membrane protein YhiD involved in acid resistance
MIGIPAMEVSTLREAAAALLTAFVLCHIIGLVYVWTHQGLSYANSFVQSLVMSGVVTATMMMAIGNNVVWGIGVVGALALVRFRINVRDARDIIFIFASLVAGVACGTRSFGLALMGTVFFCGIALYLSRIPFGVRRSFDGLLRFTAPWDASTDTAVSESMQRHCKNFVLATVREVAQGEGSERVYHVRFRRDESRQQFMRELSALGGISGVALMLEDTRIEV